MKARSPLLWGLVAAAVLVVIAVAVLIGRVTAPSPSPSPTATISPTVIPTATANPAVTTQPPAVPSPTPSATASSPSQPNTAHEIALETPPQWMVQPTPQTGQPTATVVPGSILFRTASGALVAPQLPVAASVPLPMTAYHDARDHYTLSYPAGWQAQAATIQGHAQHTLFPPGSSPSANVPGGAPALVVGWSNTAPVFDTHDSAFTDLGAVLVGSVQGHLFTIGGPMGYVITASFPRTGGYLVVSADGDNSLLIAAFEQTLASLRFDA